MDTPVQRTFSRGWESIFFFSEVAMIVMTVFGTTYSDGMVNPAEDRATYDKINLAATE